MKKSGIYQILNTINGKFYLGSAVNFKNRWSNHKWYFANKNHPNRYFQSAWNKYGADNFKFRILQLVEDISKLREIEQNWLDWTQCYERTIGYNLYKIAGSPLGYKPSKETIEKRAAKLRGVKRDPNLMKALANFNKGRKHSNEAKLKMSLGRKGIQSWLGKTHTEESKIKISLAKTGIKPSEETKIKRAKALRKLNKWPHELGCCCKCEECREKWRIYQRNYVNNRRELSCHVA